MSKYALGLDYGTLSLRTVLVDLENGETRAEAVMAYPHAVLDRTLPDKVTQLDANWALQVPHDYVESLETTVREVLAESGVDPADIIGLALDFTASTDLPVMADKTPLCEVEGYESRPHAYVKLWKHHGAQDEADRINEVLQQKGLLSHPRFGGAISPELLLPKLMEVLNDDEEIFEKMDVFMEAADWITWQLTGELKRSANFAAYKSMWYPEDTSFGGYPSPQLLEAIDPRLKTIYSDKLRGEICPAGACIGHLTKEWADRLGLQEGMAVGPGIIDSHAGMPGSGVYQTGQMMLVLGTSSVQLLPSEKAYSGHGVIGAVSGAIIPGFYALEAGLAAVGDMFAWLVDNFVPSSYEKEAEQKGVSLHQLLSDKAAAKKPGQTGLLALDWWNGNKTPYVNADLSGVLIGMTLQTRAEDIYRALIESTAYGTRMIMEEFMKSGAPVDEVIVSGGIAEKNPFLLQVFADVLNRPIRISASSQTAALGSAMYAAAAAGEEAGGYASVMEASRKLSRLKDVVYQPAQENAKVYDTLYQCYASLVGRMDPAGFKGLQTLRKLRA